MDDNLMKIETIIAKGKTAAAAHHTDNRIARNLQITVNLLLQRQDSWAMNQPAGDRESFFQDKAACFGIRAFTTQDGDVVGTFPYPLRRAYMRFSGLRPTEFDVVEKGGGQGVRGKKYVHLILIAPPDAKPYVSDFGFERFDLKQQIDSICRLTVEEDTAYKTSFFTTVVYSNNITPQLIILCSKKLHIKIGEEFVTKLLKKDGTSCDMHDDMGDKK